jgi:peptidyl-prolyl cis-trans isomerase B (cyclophilin B)
VARTRDRQRALARAKLDRQIARRAAAARKRRQIQAGTAAGLALVLIVLGALWFSGVFDPDKEKNPPQGSGKCAWNSVQGGENVKDVGRPPTGDVQTSGVETMTITTNQGVIKALIDTAKVPCAAASFSFLSSKGFFNNTPCHRLTTSGGYVLQCGDPSGSGSGGPGYQFADEVDNGLTMKPGTLAMANAGPRTNGSQFFITEIAPNWLNGKHTIFGQCKEVDLVKKIEGVPRGPGDKPETPVTITKITFAKG